MDLAANLGLPSEMRCGADRSFPLLSSRVKVDRPYHVHARLMASRGSCVSHDDYSLVDDLLAFVLRTVCAMEEINKQGTTAQVCIYLRCRAWLYMS